MAVPLTVPIFIPRTGGSIKTQLFLQRVNLRDKSTTPLIQYPLVIPHPLDEYVDSDHSDDDLFDDYDDSLYPPNLLSSQCSSLTCYSHNLSYLLPTRSFAISTSQCQPVTVSPQLSLSPVCSKSTTNLRKALELALLLSLLLLLLPLLMLSLLLFVVDSLVDVPKQPASLISRFKSRSLQIARVQALLHPLELDNESFISKADGIKNKDTYKNGQGLIRSNKNAILSFLSISSAPKELLVTLFCNPEPRDDALPTKIDANLAPVELQSWNTKEERSEEPVENPAIRIKPIRNREYRINSRFLLMYAIDCSARMEGYLPSTQDCGTGNINNPNKPNKPLVLARFQPNFDVEKVSNMSRDKLWANVILPARLDTLPTLNGSPDFHQYVFVDHDSAEIGLDNQKMMRKLDEKLSIVKLDGCNYLPWVNLNHQLKAMKPAGVMTRGPTMANGLIPSSGVLKSQFTVKGWSNKRWLPSELDL